MHFPHEWKILRWKGNLVRLLGRRDRLQARCRFHPTPRRKTVKICEIVVGRRGEQVALEDRIVKGRG